MQISNNTLLQLLVEELPKHGGWPERAMSAKQSVLDGEIYFRDRFDQLINRGIKLENVAKIQSVRITRDQYEAALAATATTDGWIDWAGGECPVDRELPVDLKFRDGDSEEEGHQAGAYRWNNKGGSGDIIAYRLHQPQDANSRANDERLEADLDECIGQPNGVKADSGYIDLIIVKADLLAEINSAGVKISLCDAIELANSLIDAGYRKQ